MFSSEEVATVAELLDVYLGRPDHGGYCFLTYREGAQLLGFACYGPTPLTRGVYDLYWIAVDPQAQGRGIGSLLLGRVEADVQARGGRMIVVQTSGRPDYTRSRCFYERHGYSRVAQVDDYYAPGDALVVYCKRLNGRGEGPHPLPLSHTAGEGSEG